MFEFASLLIKWVDQLVQRLQYICVGGEEGYYVILKNCFCVQIDEGNYVREMKFKF